MLCKNQCKQEYNSLSYGCFQATLNGDESSEKAFIKKVTSCITENKVGMDLIKVPKCSGIKHGYK